MNVRAIIDVCNARHGKNCHNCMYSGKTCAHAKRILKVEKPFEYNEQQPILRKETNK